MIQYIEQAQLIKYNAKKINQLTAADYTVNFKINQSMYDYFSNHYYDEANPLSKLAQCRLYFKTEFEKRLN